MTRTLVFLAIAALVLTVGSIRSSYLNHLTPKERIIATSRFPIVGQPAPGFVLPLLSGGELRMSDLAGHPLVINFWATWCGLCKKELPLFQALHDRDGNRIDFVSICSGSSEDAARGVLSEGGYTFPVVYDKNGPVTRTYQPKAQGDERQVTALPFTVFVDANGEVVYAQVGIFTSLEDLVGRLRAVEFPVD